MGGRNLRRIGFLIWTLAAAVLLLEGVLQLGALFVGDSANELSLSTEEAPTGDGPVVLAVGDSWVEGAEAPDGQGFVDVLARRLEQASGAHTVNRGRNGANSAHVALTVMDLAPSLTPQLVLVLVGQNNASNFYRVAEVEERLTGEVASIRLRDRLRTVKLARILWANLRGGSGYGAATTASPFEATAIQPQPEKLDCAPGYLLHRAQDDGFDGWALCESPDDPVHQLLTSPKGRAYVQRAPFDLGTGPEPGEGKAGRVADLALDLLLAVVDRGLDTWDDRSEALRNEAGWKAQTGIETPSASSPEEVLAHYALLRLGREARDWQAVRRHGGALIGIEPENLLVNLGSAEALLLAGDWRGARSHLVAAHGRAPGFADVLDLAARFPLQAMNGEVYEALEFTPFAEPLAYERARIAEGLSDPQGASDARREWLATHPEDKPVRSEEAVWLMAMGRSGEALEIVQLPQDPETGGPLLPASSPSSTWRVAVAWAGESGDSKEAVATIERALTDLGDRVDEAFLGEAAGILANYERCDALPSWIRRWYRLSGRANAAARLLRRCMTAGEAADLLAPDRKNWGPLGSTRSWRALVKAGHQPFDLLFRDLDLVAKAASAIGGQLLVLNYPSPSEDHVALREVLAEYTATRDVEVLDLWGLFDSQFSDAQWSELMAPNGHCNAAGYQVMGEAIADHVQKRGLLHP